MTHEERQKMANLTTKGEIVTNLYLYMHEERTDDPEFLINRTNNIINRLKQINLTLDDLDNIIRHYNMYDVSYLLTVNKVIHNNKK